MPKAPQLAAEVPDGQEFMGTKEAAAELDVLMSNLDQVAGLPEPYQRLAGGRIWKAETIREFAAERRARQGARKTAA